MRPHRSLLETLLHLFVKSGCFADAERAVPSLYRISHEGEVTEAILDVVMSFPGGLMSFFFDVTVRCPHSVRNAQGGRAAATRASVAAADGELEKLTRYGSQVSAVSFETYGRLGAVSQANLRHAADIAASRGGTRGRSGAELYAQWRLALERSLSAAIADVTLLSLGHSAGPMARRRRGPRQDGVARALAESG